MQLFETTSTRIEHAMGNLFSTVFTKHNTPFFSLIMASAVRTIFSRLSVEAQSRYRKVGVFNFLDYPSAAVLSRTMTNITRSDAQVSRRVSQHLMTCFAHLPLNLLACAEGRRRSAGSSVLCARGLRPEDLSILWSGEWGLQMFWG